MALWGTAKGTLEWESYTWVLVLTLFVMNQMDLSLSLSVGGCICSNLVNEVRWKSLTIEVTLIL